MSAETTRLLRDEEKGGAKRVWKWGWGKWGGRGGGYIPIATLSPQNDSCIKSTRQCPKTTTFEEKGQPKRIRAEVPLLTSLTPYR